MKLLLIGAFFAVFSDAYGNSSYIRKSPYNITGKWFLPNPTSSVFYLHFRDRISWIEADAVCQFHHSQLVTVDSASQFNDVKFYLQELLYDEPIWIGLRRSIPQGPFKWTDESVFSSDEYWKIGPAKDEKLCVESSPSDNFLWMARQCNGPDVAAFICEMSVPKWVKKSSCMESVDASITVTFHPEKNMIKAGKICSNTDVKYIECHEAGKEERARESMKQHLNCVDVPLKKEQNTTISTWSTTISYPTKNIFTETTQFTSGRSTKVQLTNSAPLNNSASTVVSSSDYNTSTETEVYNKNIGIWETNFESSTISLPQEMSFAEEPIKASKPFSMKEPTEQPPRYNATSDTILAQHKSNVNAISLIQTSQPQKTKLQKVSSATTEQPKGSAFSTYSLMSTVFSLYNATPFEESHEIFNNDKDQETFQDFGSTKKSIRVEEVGASSNSLGNILSKHSWSDEEEVEDRTYNIEGTFDSNDFANPEQPINVYKKIDMVPLEHVNRDTTISVESTAKSTMNTILKSLTEAPQKLPSFSVSSVSTTTTRKEDTLNSTSTTIKQPVITKTNMQINLMNTSTEKPAMKQQRISALLSGAENNENENLPNRKRRIINSERHSFYPYFLGRILG